MAFATSSRVEFSFREEAVYGVAETTDFQQIPFISNNLNLTKAVFEDPSVQSNRQSSYSKQGNREVAGDVAFAYAHAAYDTLLESLFFDSFTANVLDIGVVEKSLTIKVAHPDITQFRTYTGIVCNSLALEVNLDGVVQSTFGLVGKDIIVAQTIGASSVASVLDKEPMVHFDGTFKEGGTTIAVLTGISLNMDNGITSNFVLGDDTLACVTSPMVAITGTVTAYFADVALLEKFLDDTETSIEFVLDDGNGNTHTYLLPKVQFNGADIDSSDGGVIPISIPFTALYDSTTGTSVRITRSV